MRAAFKILLIILLLQGCTPGVKKAAVVVDPEMEIRQLLSDGQYPGAVAEYRRLAELYPDKSDSYHLQAAAILMSMKRPVEAGELLSGTSPQDADNSTLKTLLQAELQLLYKQPGTALELLSRDYPATTPASLRARRHRISAHAHEQLADFINAAEARLSYNSYLPQGADKEANTARIWEDLNKVDKEDLREVHRSDPQALSGWLELALINRTMLPDLETLSRSLAAWQDKYPVHPANQTIIGQIRAAGQRYHLKPRQIALLLPLRGGYRRAAEAIRDGFITAWYNSDQDRPVVKIYEANSLNIEQAYTQAVTDGADLVVGPLEKQALIKLTSSAGLSVPTLALNRIQPVPDMAAGADGNMIPPLMQFGLSPEDEARQVAERAFADGYARALVIFPNDRWGRRLYGAFRENWSALGGKILESIYYDPQGNDYSTPVKQFLNVDRSEFRAQRLRQVLNLSLENQTRRRLDVDMIFMAAFPIAGRQIIPQLRFHEAGQIPVYATSHIFTGSANPQADMDMDDVVFPDLPWILFPPGESSSIKSLINHNFQADTSAYQRLYALGVDAFHLIPYLSRLAFDDEAGFNGETGLLSMSGDGRINRKLPWAKIINGKPELIESRGGN